METITLEGQMEFCRVQSMQSTDPALRAQAAAKFAILESELDVLERLFNGKDKE